MLALDDLTAALRECAGNDQCWRAAAMPEAIVNLLHNSSHLGPGRAAAFREFLTAVRNALGDTDDDDYYRYPALENALKQIA